MKKIIPFSKEIPFKTMIGEITDITVEHTLTVTDENSIVGDFLVSGTYKMTEASQIEEPFEHRLPFTIELDQKYDLTECKINISDFYFEIINEEILKVNIEVEISELSEKSILEEIKQEFNMNTFVEEMESSDIGVELLEGVRGKISLDEAVIRSQLQKVQPKQDLMSKEEVQIPMEEVQVEVEEIVPIDIVDTAPTKKVAKQQSNATTVETSSLPKTSVSSIFNAISNTEETFSTYHVYIVRDGDTVDSIIDHYKTTREDLGFYNDLNEIKLGSKIIIPCCNE